MIARISVLYYNLKSEFLLNCDKYNMSIEEATRCENESRIWIEHLRAVDPSTDEKATAEKFGWKYYLPEAEQEEAVNVKLAEIRTTYKDLKPTDITCIDPCMGSGHILIAMFDVLMDIYESAGYDKRDAALKIVKYNIHGIDIDKRAYQLAYFAIMMK